MTLPANVVSLCVGLGVAASAHAAEPDPVAIFPLVGKGRAVKPTNRVISKLEQVGGAPVLAGRSLRKRVRKNPSVAAKKCAGESSCLAELGGRAEVGHLIAGSAARKGKATVVTFVLIAVASKEVVHQVTIDLAGTSMVEESVLVALDDLVKRAGADEPPPTVAVAEPKEPGVDEPLATGGSAAEPEPTPSDEPQPKAAATKEIAAAPVDEQSPAAVETPVAPPLEPAPWFNPSWKTWAGAGGVVGGAALLGFGAYLGGVANDLQDLDPRATQLEVAQQEGDQHTAAVGSTVMLSVGTAAVAAGIGALVWDWLDGVPVITTSVSGDGTQVGVVGTW